MRHSKRERMTTEDVNNALRLRNVEVHAIVQRSDLYGRLSERHLPFRAQTDPVRLLGQRTTQVRSSGYAVHL